MSLTDQTSVIYAAENCVLAPVESRSSVSQSLINGDIESKTLENSDLQDQHTDNSDHTDAFRAELNDSLLHKDVGKLVPGQKVNLKVFVMAVDQEAKNDGKVEAVSSENFDEQNAESLENDTVSKTLRSNKIEELGVDVTLKIPQRKISRFLVSPVLSGQLDVPKDKDFGGDSTTQIPTSEVVPTEKQLDVASTQIIPNQSAPVETSPVVLNNAASVNNGSSVPSNVTAVNNISTPLNNGGAQINAIAPTVSNVSVATNNVPVQPQNVAPTANVTPLVNNTPVSVEPLRKISAPLETTNIELDRPEQKMSVCSLKEEITKEETGQVCGPELINTLEQLKISLDNLKHSSHPKKDSTESDPKKVASNIDISSKQTTAQLPQSTSSQILPPVTSNLSAQSSQNIPQPQSIPQQTIPQPTVAAPNQQAVPQPLLSQVVTPSPQVISQPQQNILAGPIPQTQPVIPPNISTNVTQIPVQAQQNLPPVQQNLISSQQVLPQPQIGHSGPQVIAQSQPVISQGQHNLTQSQVLQQTQQGMPQTQQNIPTVQQNISQQQINMSQAQQGIPQPQQLLSQQTMSQPQHQQGLPQSQQCVPQNQSMLPPQGLVQTQPVLSQSQPVLQSQNLHSQSQPVVVPQSQPQMQPQHIITSQPLPTQTTNLTHPVIASSVPSSMSQNFVPVTMPPYNVTSAASQPVNFISSASVPQQVVTPAQPNLTTMTTQAIQPPIPQALPPGSLPSQDVPLKVNMHYTYFT